MELQGGTRGLQGYKGDKGDPGTDYTPMIGDVETLDPSLPATVSTNIDEEQDIIYFNFGIPKGDKGDTGDTNLVSFDVVNGELKATDENGIIYNLGTVAMEPKGAYDNTVSYEKLNTVLYNDSTYMAIKPTLGNLPTDTEYWQLIGGGLTREDIVDNLDSNDATKMLSAKQGKVLNEGKIQVFDTVALMKAADLKEGMTAKTLGYYAINDEGTANYKITNTASATEHQETLNNGLYATLIIDNYATPEMFGAYGDNTHDDILSIQALLDYVASNNKYKVVMNKEYLITAPINIQYDYCNIEINGKINYTGNSHAVRYNGLHGRLYIDRIYSSQDGVLIEGTNTKASAYNEFNFNYMYCDNDGIVEHANSGFLQYNEFKFKNIRADNICINLVCENNANSWITESKYWGGHMSAKSYPGYNEYCIYANGHSGQYISTQKFYNVGFEGTKVGCHLENCSACVFEHFRNREAIQSLLFELVGKCNRNEFYGEGIFMKFLDWSGLTSFSSANKFSGTFLTNGASLYNFTEFVVDHVGMKWNNQNCLIYANAGADVTYTLDPSKSWYGFPNYILVQNNVNVTLDTKYYNATNINQLYLIMGSSTTNKILDQNGNTLIDLAGHSLGYKKVKVTFTGQSTSNFSPNGILIEEVTPIT